jgi:TRL-like protein family
MKKNILSLATIVLFTVVLTSCSVTIPLAVSDAKMGAKRGESTTTTIFGLIDLNSDFGVKEAATNGKITGAIATVDIKVTNYYFFSKKTLIVTAE